MFEGDEKSGDCNGTEWISFRKTWEGSCGRRTPCCWPATSWRGSSRFILLGATTLFLPVLSYVLSTTSEFDSCISSRDRTEGPYALDNSAPALIAQCDQGKHLILVVTWALLVQNVMTNMSVVVAVDDREGRSVGPYALILAKLALKYYAVKEAQQSFSFGRNPRLVFRYVQQLPLTVGEHSPLPLLVMGEETRHVEKEPHGYVFEDDGDEPGTRLHKGIGLVTMDRVWQLDSNSMLDLPAPTTQRVKDLCLSYALFKLLRCRFARYELSENTSIFFWSQLLKDDSEAHRVFGVVADELSFLHDYYYTSLPISYSKRWLPIVGIVISLLSIGYCIFLVVWMLVMLIYFEGVDTQQLWCVARCHERTTPGHINFGSLYFDAVPLFLLSVFVVTGEAKDVTSYLCSNWTKVALTCRLLSGDEPSISMRKWSARLLRFRCKLIKHWDVEMGQCSVLTPLHRPPRTTLLAPVGRLLYLADDKREVNAAVKVSIISALRNSRNGQLSNGTASLCRWSQGGGERLLWACNSKSASDVILIWQIATSILEVRYPDQHQAISTSDSNRTVATHLSRYCAYLVRWHPELLPDDDAWSKSLYEDVNKDARQALAAGSSSTPPDYQRLVQLLSARSKHPVLKDGVKLAEQLVETISGEEIMAWQLLANFWSEMILYVTPSENLKGHKESVARGGELITLLWAMLSHAGFVSRTSDAARKAAAAAADRPAGDAATSSAGGVV
ncbi:unnamed protein product [Urochloa decumbens]|uniref:DUF4220 domain-containing protein n=1 Tax=Urochloa decumbens TaxID=240449 RepID=A0ABC9B4E5_9POAL